VATGARGLTMLVDAPTTARFTRWFSQRIGADVRIERASTPGTGGGWSNETLIVDLSRLGRVVVRLQPAGPSMFRTYELAREYTILETLSARGQPNVPKPLAIDEHGTIAGRPLFVMSYIPGRVPSDDRPSFAEAGWLFEASLEEQRTFYIGLLAAIAEVHAVDWRPKLATLARAVDHPLQGEVDWLRALHRWGAGSERHATIERGFGRLAHSMPLSPPPCLLWGDARPANVVETAFKPAALLDWELASIGPAELDIAWFLEMNRMRTVGAGVAPLPGFLPDDETVACYQRLSGRRLADLTWYRQYAALKMAVLMERHLRVAIARGALRQDHRLLKDNVALRRVEALLAEAKPEGRYSAA
jgi:aminoglycoside phosphotransferase (APT) family kinase protein